MVFGDLLMLAEGDRVPAEPCWWTVQISRWTSRR